MSLPVAVVLGAIVRRDGTPGHALIRRAHHATTLYLAGEIDHLILCGGRPGRDAGQSEAGAMRAICLDAGVPAQAITLEETSESTIENLRNARALLPDVSGQPIVLITDAFHAPRARLLARRLGLSVTISSPSLRGAPKRRLIRTISRETLAYCACVLRLRG